MSIAAIYVRKSKYTGKGESIANQLDMCKKYAQERNLKTKKDLTYFDEGFSGSNTDRPAFQKMINDAKNKKFDILICYRLDRISRSISDFSATMDILKKYNISFISIKEQFDTSTPMGRAMMYIASVFAQLERETIAERIKDNMLQLARTGRWLGGITPTGFKSEPLIYYDKELNKRKMYILSPIYEELETVKKLFNKYLELGSLSKLQTYCLKFNLKSKNNKIYKKNTLKNILNNPVYAVADESLYEYFLENNMDIANDKVDFDGTHGVLVYNKNIESIGKSNRQRDKKEWIVAVSNHKGIIPSKEWIQVQRLLEKNKGQAPRKGTSNKALLSGLIVCGKCNEPMRVKYGNINPKTGKRHYYYVCTLKENSRSHKCNNSNLKGLTADELVINNLKKLFHDNKEIINYLNNIRQKQSPYIDEDAEYLKHLKNLISINEISIQNLVKELSKNKNSIVAKYIIKEIEKLDKENQKLNLKLLDYKNKLEKNKHQTITKEIDKMIKDIDNLFNINKKKLIKCIIDKIYWQDGTLEIKLKTNDM